MTSKRYLQQLSERIRARAGRAYIEQRSNNNDSSGACRSSARAGDDESDAEIRAAVRGWLAAEGGY